MEPIPYIDIQKVETPAPKFKLGQTVYSRDYAGNPNDWPLVVTSVRLSPVLGDGEVNGETDIVITRVEWKYATCSYTNYPRRTLHPHNTFWESELSGIKG